jgi:hypothetical protein
VIASRTRDEEGFTPSFLQGHCGDVNPGDGTDWRGEIGQTTAAIRPALKAAIANAVSTRADTLRSIRVEHCIPYNTELFRAWIDEYRRDPKACTRGPWVDAGFAEDWYRGNAGRTLPDAGLSIELSALRIGDVALVFHPAELYSYYGLALRRSSPFPHTWVVGYTDDLIGYLTDPTAYRVGEYAAITVPKILDFPPFAESAARGMSAAAESMLRKLAS